MDILPEDVVRCNVDHIVRLFGEIGQLPEKAKALRGLVFLGFPSFENDPRPNWLIPEIRQYIQKLDSKIPHFCYFLTSEVPAGFLRAYMYCLLDINLEGSIPQAIWGLVQRLEKDVRGFCNIIGDLPDP